jgi:hypothetical protein
VFAEITAAGDDYEQSNRTHRQRHPAETSAATHRVRPSDTSASEIRPRARPIRGTRPAYRSLVYLPRRMSFRLPVPPLNRLLAYVLVDEGQRPRAGVQHACIVKPCRVLSFEREPGGVIKTANGSRRS